MTLTREIIVDLLPVYMAGEVSAATRAAVEEYLNQDADLRARVESAQAIRLYGPELPAPDKAVEKRALHRTQRLLSWKSWLIGLSMFFTMLPMSFVVRDRTVTFQLARDLPLVALASLVAALGGWIAYAWVCRRLQATGLEPPKRWSRRLAWLAVGFFYGNMAGFVAWGLVEWKLLPGLAIVTAMMAVALGEWMGQRKC